MSMLVAGLAIWILVHLFPSVLSESRQALITRLGNGPYQGLFALCILAGLMLIIFGWRSTVPEQWYLPPPGLRNPASALSVIAFILFVAANFPATRIKRVNRHPQLTGVLVWAVAHLLSSGDSRSAVLFGAIGAWSLVSMVTISRRDGDWVKPDPPNGWTQDILVVVIGLVVSAVVIYFHQYLAEIPLIA